MICCECGLEIRGDKWDCRDFVSGEKRYRHAPWGCFSALRAEVERLKEKERASLDSAARAVVEWANETFPDANPESLMAHLAKEVLELLQDPTDPYEIADVFFLLVQLADSSGVNLAQAVRHKLEINKRRAWGPPDEHGVIEHIRDEEPAPERG